MWINAIKEGNLQKTNIYDNGTALSTFGKVPKIPLKVLFRINKSGSEYIYCNNKRDWKFNAKINL